MKRRGALMAVLDDGLSLLPEDPWNAMLNRLE